MTHREFFNRRKRIFMACFFFVLFVGLTTGYISVNEEWEWLFLVAYFCVPVLFVVLYVAVIFGFRCPSCRGQWGWIAMYSGSLISIRKGLQMCPYCGKGLDTPLTSKDESDSSMSP
jgi:hypothetical protein